MRLAHNTDEDLQGHNLALREMVSTLHFNVQQQEATNHNAFVIFSGSPPPKTCSGPQQPHPVVESAVSIVPGRITHTAREE